MAIENISDEQSQKIGKRWLALIIPFLYSALFYVFCTLFIYIWSQDLEESRRLGIDFLSPFNENYGVNRVFFVIGFLAGLLPTIIIFTSSGKKLGRNLTISIFISFLILVISFCGFSWISMWLINP